MDKRMGRIEALVLAGIVVGAVACADTGEQTGGQMEVDTAATAAPDTQAIVISEGLSTPESVLYDPEADVYLVSNIQGEPVRKDGRGFISRVLPDGTMEAERWIDGETGGVTLHAPKGLALKGDTLFVADIDTVRAFDRQTGEPWGGRGIEGASFLNDLAVGDDVLYVTDTGVNETFTPTGSAALYRFGPNGAERLAEGLVVESPNGVAVGDDALWVVSFASGDVQRIPLDGGEPELLTTLPGGELDGIVHLDDGSLLVSSWETSTVYRISPDGEAEAIIEGVEAPADIGFDPQRERVLIPLFTSDRVEARPIN